MSQSRSGWWHSGINWGDVMELERLKALLGISKADASQDTNLRFAMDNAEEIIRNYCNVEDVPQGLVTTAYRMSMDVFRAEAVGESGFPQSVTSIREGDTSTSFGNRSDAIKDTILKDYKAQLNKYRKVGW